MTSNGFFAYRYSISRFFWLQEVCTCILFCDVQLRHSNTQIQHNYIYLPNYLSNPILSYPILLYLIHPIHLIQPFYILLQEMADIDPLCILFYKVDPLLIFSTCFFFMWWAKLHLYLCHFTDQIHYLLFYTPCFDLYERGAKIVVRVRVENYDVMLGKR